MAMTNRKRKMTLLVKKAKETPTVKKVERILIIQKTAKTKQSLMEVKN
jgi:hypothetical protein